MKLLWAVLAFTFLASAPAQAIGGPALTKRERALAERQSSGRVSAASKPKPASGLREEIERSFLLEDYAAVERLAREFETQKAPSADHRDVQYLRAVSLVKLRKPDVARPILEGLLSGSRSERERIRLSDSLDQTRPLAVAAPAAAHIRILAPAASAPARQQAVEEQPRYAVQVGSFSKEKNANALVRRLIERHYEAFIERGTPLYRVRVGPLPSRDEAARIEALLKKDGFPTKIVP